MKKYVRITVLAGVLLIGRSCRKGDGGEYGGTRGWSPERKVRYELYTREDSSGNEETILFNLFMRTGGRQVFDTALAPMKIGNIPDFLHRIIIEEPVPDGITDTLIVGFAYNIEGVGISWHDELFPAGDTLKVVKFSFD